MNETLRLLVMTDFHYASSPALTMTGGDGGSSLGKELMQRVIVDARRFGGFDAIAILGDLVNDGSRPQTDAELAEMAKCLAEAAPGVRTLVIPGNHDIYPAKVLDAFGQTSGLLEIGGYRLVAFADPFAGDFCTRVPADRQRLKDLARQGGGPLVVLQHNPVYPPVESDYPYMHTNNAEVLADYAQAGVLLSLSGHNHEGSDLVQHEGVGYATIPAVRRSPHRYGLLQLTGREVKLEIRQLKLDPTPAVWDCHAHTQFAYCGEDITAPAIIERAGLFGLAGVCLVEHAPQLYCTKDDFWNARHIHEPALWRNAAASRMAQFRQAIEPLRGPAVRIGLEVEVDKDGCVTVTDEDAAWVDLLVGAMHWIDEDAATLSDQQLAQAFMKGNLQLLEYGVDVLAHPLRMFGWVKREVPKDIYAPLADALAATATAAEINLHKNQTDPAFLEMCIERGVKISLGSDTHALYEAGAMQKHLAILRDVAGKEDVSDILYVPPGL